MPNPKSGVVHCNNYVLYDYVWVCEKHTIISAPPIITQSSLKGMIIYTDEIKIN